MENIRSFEQANSAFILSAMVMCGSVSMRMFAMGMRGSRAADSAGY